MRLNVPLSDAGARNAEASTPRAGQAASGSALYWFQFKDGDDANDAGLVFGRYGMSFSGLAEEVRRSLG